MPSSTLPSTSSPPTQSSTVPMTRKFAWDWFDDDQDDAWLEDALHDVHFASPLSSMTPVSSTSASAISNTLGLTLSKLKAPSPLSHPPTTASRDSATFADALHPIPPNLLTSTSATHHSSSPPKLIWRTIRKPAPIDRRASKAFPMDAASGDHTLLPSKRRLSSANDSDAPIRPLSNASSISSSPKSTILSFKSRPGPVKLRVRREKSMSDKSLLPSEAAKIAEKKKSQLCLAYVSGSCHRGESCAYMHYDVLVAPPDAVETCENLHFVDNETKLAKPQSTVLLTNDPVSQVPFYNPFSPPNIDNSALPAFSVLLPSPGLQQLFISQSTESNLPSLQPDGWWDKEDHLASSSLLESPLDSVTKPHLPASPSKILDLDLSTPMTGSSFSHQRRPRLHLIETNLASKWHTHPRGAPAALASYSFPTVPDTIFAPMADVLYAPANHGPADGKRRESPRGRRWSIDGSMHGYKPGPCKYYQISEPCPFGEQCPFNHSTPEYRAPATSKESTEVGNLDPPPELEPTLLMVEPELDPPLPASSSQDTISSVSTIDPPATPPHPAGLTVYPTARVLSGGIRFGDMVSLTSKKGKRAVRAQTEVLQGIKVRDVNAGVIMVDAETEDAIEKVRQRAIAQQAQDATRLKGNTVRRGSQPNPVIKRRPSRASAGIARRGSVASSSALTSASESDAVCGMYKATGQCRFGTTCKFRHDVEPLNIPGVRGSFEVFGTKKPMLGPQGTKIPGSSRRGSIIQTPQSSSALSLTLQTPPSNYAGLGQGLPTSLRSRKSLVPHFPTLPPSRRTSSITSDSTSSDAPLNFSLHQSRHPSLDRIDIVAYPDATQAISMDEEQEDMVNMAILQSIMRVPTPTPKPHDKLEHKTLSSLILAETMEPSTSI